MQAVTADLQDLVRSNVHDALGLDLRQLMRNIDRSQVRRNTPTVFEYPVALLYTMTQTCLKTSKERLKRQQLSTETLMKLR